MEEIRRLLDKLECIELSNAFSYYLDNNMAEEFANLFVPDGVWLRHGAPLKGRPAIKEVFRNRKEGYLTRHVTTGHFFTSMTEKTAEAVCSNRSYYSMGSGDLPRAFVGDQVIMIDFLDSYVKTPEGWRFSRRDCRYVMMPEDMRPHFIPETQATA